MTRGGNEVILRGPDNLIEWQLHIQEVATEKGIWSILTGNETLTRKPVEPGVPYAIPYGAVAEDGVFEADRYFQDHLDGWKRATDTYCRDLEHFYKQNRRAYDALNLLHISVQRCLIVNVGVGTDPAIVYRSLVESCGKKYLRALYQFHRSLRDLKLGDCQDLSHYWQRIISLQDSIACLRPQGFTRDNALMINQMITGLPSEYDNFIEAWQQKQDDYGVRDPHWTDFLRMLENAERSLRERGAML